MFCYVVKGVCYVYLRGVLRYVVKGCVVRCLV